MAFSFRMGPAGSLEQTRSTFWRDRVWLSPASAAHTLQSCLMHWTQPTLGSSGYPASRDWTQKSLLLLLAKVPQRLHPPLLTPLSPWMSLWRPKMYVWITYICSNVHVCVHVAVNMYNAVFMFPLGAGKKHQMRGRTLQRANKVCVCVASVT